MFPDYGFGSAKSVQRGLISLPTQNWAEARGYRFSKNISRTPLTKCQNSCFLWVNQVCSDVDAV